jgi:hypothetical protein
MKTTKLSHLLFSLALIAALVLTATPSMPVYAMSDSAPQQNTSIGAADIASSMLSAGAVVCRSITFWRNGHRVTVRICHRMHKDKA